MLHIERKDTVPSKINCLLLLCEFRQIILLGIVIVPMEDPFPDILNFFHLCYLINSMSAHLRTGEEVMEDEAGIGEGSTAAAIIAAAVDC